MFLEMFQPDLIRKGHVKHWRKNGGNSGEAVSKEGKRICPVSVPLMMGVKGLPDRAKGILIGILIGFRRPKEERRAAAKRRKTDSRGLPAALKGAGHRQLGG